jgi:type II restriction/modification system DNA methylase subunit YeeA
MNRTALKNYAPQARRAFIQAVTDRAAYYGLTINKIEPVVQKGDVAVIAGLEHPRAVAGKRKQLEERIKRYGFEPTMEAVAYTWFNRLVAIRFMELHGYLEHGYRVLSHPEGKATPEILEQAEHVALAGLKHDVVVDLKLAGNKEDELYRLLLTVQCNALHAAMPFLFERIDDETELLLPSNLLNSDSLVRKLVGEIDEQDWQQVEIIGWLYQFYISEKKGEVIGKVVASEDIPAATQLFTPNWIVKYLVQNTLGRQWLAAYPQSALRQQMEYYIEPAEQTPEVQEQLKAITRTSLNPEELTLLDPACGSGHILVEAYDLFKAIYQERGYRAKDIPVLILQKNLFGLEIDDRAAQLAAFALMMKARADDRRILDSEAQPNILVFEDSHGMNASEITHALNSPINQDDIPGEYLFEEIQEDKDGLFSKKALAEKGHVSQVDITSLLDLFQNAKTFGSLIQVPLKLSAKLPEIEKRLDDVVKSGDLTHFPAHVIRPLLQQARLLLQKYDAVVANPPYMGIRNGMNSVMKAFANERYKDSRSDLFSMFVERWSAGPNAVMLGFVTPYVWMFISSFETFRQRIAATSTITSLVQLEYNAFEPACVPVCAFTLLAKPLRNFQGDFIRLADFKGHQQQAPRTQEAIRDENCGWRYRASTTAFQSIPGSPIAYWVSDRVRKLFADSPPISTVADARQGMATSDNGKFVRFWHEVAVTSIGFGIPNLSTAKSVNRKWFPYNKGGVFRRWYGNQEHVVNWANNGEEIKETVARKYPYLNGNVDYVVKNREYYFRESVSWSDITVADNAFRCYETGFIFDACAHSAFCTSNERTLTLLGYLNNNFVRDICKILNPTMHFHVGYFKNLPFPKSCDQLGIASFAKRAIEITKDDWDSIEKSWNFADSPMLKDINRRPTIEQALLSWVMQAQASVDELNTIEVNNNKVFLEAYGLQNDISADVSQEYLTLYRPDQTEGIKHLLSYAIGCIMGRYSLDKPGLIYADSGNRGFDPSQYKTLQADDDGIIPLLETEWGIRDDSANRIVEFMGVAWPKEHLNENLKFIADRLGPSSNEQPRDTIRRYLATGFYKHHLSMYRRRPIYWLFSSGKQRAFQCLVYLHRYHEGTLARMRTEYVIPLQGQIASRIEQLENDKAKATSTSHRNRLQKEHTDLKKQQAELLIFEEKLKHLADQKVTLDLDDGVKVNYAKFGDLLADSKVITGGKDDE